MTGRTSNIVLIGMITGAVLGVVGGYYFGDTLIHIKFLGTIFLNALKMVVIPLVIASMIVGVTSLGDIRKLGRTTGKTLLYYLATTGFSVLVGLVLVNLISPGQGVPPIGAGIPEFVPESTENTIVDVFVRLVPDNIIGAAASGKILPLIVFSLLFGGVLTTIGNKGKPIIALFEGINAAIMKIVMLIIYFAPIGVFALIAGIVAKHRDSVDELLSALGLYSLTVIVGLLIHAVITLPLILRILGRKNPFQYFANMGQALATAFTTASSSATLPVTMECVGEKNRVDRKASSFVLPLGATINMDGTALYEAVAALFIAQIYGIDLSIGAQVIIFFTAVLASIGAAAIPEAGLVMMTLVLSAVGLPLEGIGIILAIDWFLDRCRTTVNVWGDSIGAAVIGETSEMKNYVKYTPERTPPSKIQTRDSAKARSDWGSRERSQRDQNGRKKARKSGERKERHERSARQDRGPRHERSSRKDRASRHEGSPHTEKQHKPRRETKQMPKVTSDKEAEKVGNRHASRNDAQASGEKLSKEKPQAEEKGKERFFDVEFSKMDFFDTEPAKEDSPEKTDVTQPESERSEAADDSEKKSHGGTSARVSRAGENDKEEESGDFWGRGRKKRTSR